MNKLLAPLTVSLMATACVQVKSPENLASDTYEAGKTIYRDIRDSIRGKEGSESNRPGSLYAHEVLAHDGESFIQTSQRCYQTLYENTRRELNRYQLNIAAQSSDTTNKSAPPPLTVRCSIELAERSESNS